MSKKQSNGAVIAATPKMEEDIPSTFAMDIPEYTTAKSVAITGSKSRAIGYGVMPSTGKDGRTKTWIISLLVIKPNGKGKLSSLQDTVQNLSAGEAKGYNPFTKDFKTEIEALRACAKCANDFNGYILKNEMGKINAAKAAGQWEVAKEKKDDKKKVSPSDFGVTLAERITAKYAGNEKWECFNSVYSAIIEDNDKLGLAKDIISVLRKSIAVDYAVVDKIISKAIDDIRAAEIATLEVRK